jgi:NADPH2:quinone reductase
MKAVLCKAFGPPESLVVEDVASPTPVAGEVVVDIRYAALNFFDTLIIQGKYQVRPPFPFSPAGEFAGRIAAVGEGVSGFAVGDRVLGSCSHGAARQQIAVPAASVSKIPDSLTDEAAAGLSIAYGTTIHALSQRGRLAAGESLVVLGASGGTGLAAVEIGKLMGARVIAGASSEEKCAVARKAGADETINYGANDLREELKKLTGANGVDVVYDAVGGSMTEAALRSMAWRGRLLVIGFASGEIPKLPANLALLKGCDIVGVWWGEFVKREPEANRQNIAQLIDWAGAGKLAAQPHRIYPMSRIAEALDEIAGRRAVGKILLDVAG